MASSIHNIAHNIQKMGGDTLAHGYPHLSPLLKEGEDQVLFGTSKAGRSGPFERIAFFFKTLCLAVKDVFTDGRSGMELLLKAEQERALRFKRAIVDSVEVLIQPEKQPERANELRWELAEVLMSPQHREAARTAIIEHHQSLPDADAKTQYRDAVIRLSQDLLEKTTSDEAVGSLLEQFFLAGFPAEHRELAKQHFDKLPPEELQKMKNELKTDLTSGLEDFKTGLQTFFKKGIVQEQLHLFVDKYAEAAEGDARAQLLEKTGKDEELKPYFTGTLHERTLMSEIAQERWADLKASRQKASERLDELKSAAKKAEGTERFDELEALRNAAEETCKEAQEKQHKYQEALKALLKHLETKDMTDEQKVAFGKLAAQMDMMFTVEPPWWIGLGKLGASIGLSGMGDSLLSPYLGIYATPFIGSAARHYAESAPIGQTGRRFAVDAAGYAAAYRLFPDSPVKRLIFQIATAIGNAKLDGYAPLESLENRATGYLNSLWARMFGTSKHG